jgi:Protein of unknown function (DUF2846)
VELWKLAKVLAALTLTALATQSCALRPRFNDLVSKEETAKALKLRVVNAESRAPIAGASVELGDGPYRVRLVSDAQGVVTLPVNKRYRDDNAVIAVTLAAGLPRYELVPVVDGEVIPSAEAPAPAEASPAAAAPVAVPAPAGKKSLDFKPANAANGLVVVYRNTSGMMGSGSMLGATLKVNKEAVGDLAHDTYLVVELAPGRHTVTAQSAAGESNWLVTLAAGQVEYAQLQPMPFRLNAKAAAEALGEMRADAETLSQSGRVNLGAPAESKQP